MHHDNMLERMAIVEQRLDEGERRFNELKSSIEQCATGINTVNSSVVRLATTIELNAKQQCPAPGTCVALKGEIEKVRESIKPLEADRNQRIGSNTIIGAISGIVGAALVAILNWFLQRNTP